MSTGLTRCASKPALVARSRSWCWPYPVRATSRGASRPHALESFRHLVPVHHRKPDVEEHHLRSELVGQRERAEAIVATVTVHPVPLGLRQQLGQLFVVVDHHHRR